MAISLYNSADLPAALSFFFQAEDGIRDLYVTGVQTCALPISTEVKKTKTKTIINRSQRYRLYAPVTDFTTEDITEIRKSLLHLYDKLYSLTDISVKSIKRQDKSIVKFIVVEFYVESQAKKALLMPIPMTIGVYFRILNEQSQLAEQVNAASSASPNDISTPGHMPGQVTIHSEFADRTAQRIDCDNRTVKVMDIPLSFDEAAVKAVFNQFGIIESVRMTTKNSWQQAFVTFVEEKSINPFFAEWGFIYLKHFLKVAPVKLPSAQWNLRSAYVLKLTGLPTGTTVVDLVDIISATRAKSCIIPKGLRSYMPRPFAFLAFECEKDYNQALETSFALDSSDLSWCTLKTKLCSICRFPSHAAKTCPKNKDKVNRRFERIYNRYKPANYQKLLSKKSTTNNNNRNNQSQRSSDPTVRQDRSYASTVKGSDKDDLSASIHNPNNNQRNQTRNQNQGQNHNQNQNRRHNIGNNQMSVVEKAILESLDSMHDKFDNIARRVTALERKFADMDAFLEEQFPSNDEPIFETREEYEAYHNNPPHSWDAPEVNNNMTILDDSETYTVPPHIPSKDTNPAKRPATSSAEDTPEYKILKAEFDRVTTFSQTQQAMYHELKSDFAHLSRQFQEATQQAQTGPAQ